MPHFPRIPDILDDILEPVTTPLSYVFSMLVSLLSKHLDLVSSLPYSSLDNGIPHWETVLLWNLVEHLSSKATTSLWPGFCLIALLAAYSSWYRALLTHKYDIPRRGHFRNESLRLATEVIELLLRLLIAVFMAFAYLSACARLADVLEGAPEMKESWTLSDDRLPLTARLEWVWLAMHLHTSLRSIIGYAAR